MNLGEKVRLRREQLDWSQEELADRMGYKSRSSINKIENGRAVSQKIIFRLSEVLGVSVAYLMGYEDKPEESASFHVKILTDAELMAAIEDYYKLNEENKKMVRDLIHNLKKTEA